MDTYILVHMGRTGQVAGVGSFLSSFWSWGSNSEAEAWQQAVTFLAFSPSLPPILGFCVLHALSCLIYLPASAWLFITHVHTCEYAHRRRTYTHNTIYTNLEMIERYYLWSHSTSLKFSNSHDSSWEQNRLGEIRVPCLSSYPRHTIIHILLTLYPTTALSESGFSFTVISLEVKRASLCSMWHRYKCFLEWLWSPQRQIWSCLPLCSESSSGFCPFLNSCELFS